MCVVAAAAVPYLFAASMATTAASTYMAYQGSQQQAKAQEASANYQAQVAHNNQIIATQNADQAIQAGEAQEQAQRLKTAQVMSSQRVAMAANGLSLDSGSAADVQAGTAEMGELDALTIRSNASKTAYNYLAQAGNYGAQANLYEAQAGWASSAGELNGYSALIGGAASLSSKWMTYNAMSGSTPTTSSGGSGGTFSQGYQTPSWYDGKGYSGGYGF